MQCHVNHSLDLNLKENNDLPSSHNYPKHTDAVGELKVSKQQRKNNFLHRKAVW